MSTSAQDGAWNDDELSSIRTVINHKDAETGDIPSLSSLFELDEL